MNLRRGWNLALCAAMLILANGLCDEADGFTALDELQCGTLVMVCDGTEHTVMVGVKDLSQNVDGQTRYLRFWDCTLDEWLQSLCPATCTLKMR